MIATVKLDDPKHRKGDIIQWGSLALHITCVRAEGTWFFYDGEGEFKVDVDWEGTYRYVITVQAGYNAKGNAIRPGTVMGFSETYVNKDIAVYSIGDSKNIKWNKPIISPDSLDNIGKRRNAWDFLTSKGIDNG